MKGATLMQELIEGADDQVFQYTALVNTQGEIAAYSTVRKLRQYPAGYGSMCYGQTEKNEALAAEGRKLILALGYRGLGSLEFKYRQKDGGYYFIEMNTRLPWYNGLFADAGVNLPYLAYLDLTSGISEPNAASLAPPQQRDGTTWIGYHNYAACFREIKPQRTHQPSDISRPRCPRKILRLVELGRSQAVFCIRHFGGKAPRRKRVAEDRIALACRITCIKIVKLLCHVKRALPRLSRLSSKSNIPFTVLPYSPAIP